MSGPGAQSTDEPTADQPAAAHVEPEPTPTVPHGEATRSHPAGTALPTGGVEALERPEAQVGMAFAGGLLAALILKRLVG